MLGQIPPIQYCENQNPQISVSEQYAFVFAILPPIESQGFGYSTQNKFDGCKKGKEEKPVAPEDTTNNWKFSVVKLRVKKYNYFRKIVAILDTE